MRWIKIAIGAVIAISIIPLVVLSVINIKKSLKTEKITITIELNYYMHDADVYGFALPIDFFDELIDDYFEKGFVITNLYDYTNDINITITNFSYSGSGYLELEMFDNNSVWYSISGLSSIAYTMYISRTYDSVYNVNAPDIVLMDITLTKSNVNNVNLVATLISFVPIIFVGGVVLFFYKPFKKD